MNSSLSSGMDSLIYKEFYNIGIAVDTDAGLIVPNIKTAKSVPHTLPMPPYKLVPPRIIAAIISSINHVVGLIKNTSILENR